jgi:hypothetical protein
MADKDKASDRVWRSRSRALDTLQISIEVLAKECSRLEKKIKEEGLEGNYSINSDVLRWARRVHSACYELSILSEVQIHIDDNCNITEKSRKENYHGTEGQVRTRPKNDSTIASFTRSCWVGASRTLRKWKGSETMATCEEDFSRQAEAQQQECLPREGTTIMWWRLEALMLISVGLGLGFLLFGKL